MLLRNANPFITSALGMSCSKTSFESQGVKNWKGAAAPTNPYHLTIGQTFSLNTLMAYHVAHYSNFTNYYNNASANQSTYWYGVIFGSGNDPVTFDDYKLSGDAIFGLSSSNVTHTQTYEDDGVTRSLTTEYTISNTTGADITIGEVGLFTHIYSSSNKDSSSNYYLIYDPILIERTALDEPVVIPAGGIGRVTYTLNLSYPTAP